MSIGSHDNPFASPEGTGPKAQEWQGTPVPPPPAPRPERPLTPPDAGYAQAPPPPGAYVSPEATAYPAAPRPYGAHYPSEAQAVAQPVPAPRPPVNIPPPPHAQHYPQQQAVAYPPPPPGYGYGYAPQYAPGPDAKNWMGITSLVLSLVTLIFGITCIGGIILGHLGVAAAKRGEANNRGLAMAGLIIGYVFLSLGVLFFGLVFIAALSDESSHY